jgi:hypothetical protein
MAPRARRTGQKTASPSFAVLLAEIEIILDRGRGCNSATDFPQKRNRITGVGDLAIEYPSVLAVFDDCLVSFLIIVMA